MNQIDALKKANVFAKKKLVENDFSITVATINGSGSQTSNLTILRAIFRMGIPVSGKNIFPSNIQGQPTWYTIRVNKHGFVARKDEQEIVVAMNPDTFSADLKSVFPGGVFFYKDDIKLKIDREDIIIYPMPVKQLTLEADVPSNLRNYVENMVYVGVLAQVLGIDLEKVQQSLVFHFRGKQAPIDLNFKLVNTGFIWAQDNIVKIDPYIVKPMEVTQELIMSDGNTAAALGAIYGGVHFISWYPITPATSLAESLQHFLPLFRKDPETKKNTFAIVQAEDELAAVGMAIGAGWAGLRSMTSTSGPGFSLMTEYIGLAYFSEVPVVIWDVQRAGPSTGLPTRTSQGDILFAHFIGHGDTQLILLIPGTVNECFEFGWKAFDIAEKLQTPIIVLSDLDFGMNQWMTQPFQYPDQPMDRGKILWEEDLEKLYGEWARYKDIDGDFIPYRTLPGNNHPHSAYFARGTGHNEFADYSENPADWNKLLQRLKNKFEAAKDIVPEPIFSFNEQAEVGILCFGSTLDAVEEVRADLQKSGIITDLLRIRAIPFTDTIEKFIQKHERNYVVEMNRDGQMHKLLILEYPFFARFLISISYVDGLPLTATRIFNAIMGFEKRGEMK